MCGHVYAEENSQDPVFVSIRELNQALQTDERFDYSLTTIGDGLTFLRKIKFHCNQSSSEKIKRSN
jgi:predicted O-methyltransferase YrrM